MKAPYRIRRTDDLDTIVELDKELIGVPLGAMLEDCTWWVVETPEGRAVAYTGAQLTDNDQYAYITRQGVLLEARGHHLQHKLIRTVERWARAKGASHVWTYTSWDNVASMKSFIRLGYVPYKAADEEGFCSLSFTKLLRKAK